MKFTEKLSAIINTNKSFVCVGLDTDPERIPQGLSTYEFNRSIVDATLDLVCAYKLNLAFYEAQGNAGMDALLQTIQYIPDTVPVIADAKRGDIGNTARAYARALFSTLGVDAATVNPYLGFDSLEPFIEYEDKAIFILCKTSNPGSNDFQMLKCRFEGKELPLFEVVAHKTALWNKNNNIGLVVGATYPDELKIVRKINPDMPILIPGIGAQGGDLAASVQAGINSKKQGILINSSRQIIYASQGSDFAEAARQAALTLRDNINRHVPDVK